MALPNNPTQSEVVKAIKDLENSSGGTATDVQVNGTSIVSNNVANIVTESAYNASTNKIATKNDIPTKTSKLTNDSGFITSASLPTVNNKTITIQKNGSTVESFTTNQSTDETINITMSKSDVGLSNVDNVKQYSASNPPPYPVTSVNGQTGAVTGLAKTTQTYTRVFKSVADLGLTAPALINDVVYAFISHQYTNSLFLITNDNFNNVTGTPEGYGSLFIETASNYLRPKITYVKQIGDSVANTSPVAFKQWTANVIRGTNNIVTGVEWFEIMTDKQVSNPNLLINSNFAINQRDGYFATAGVSVYANSTTTYSQSTLVNAVQTKLVSSTKRSATGCVVVEQFSNPNASGTLAFYAVESTIKVTAYTSGAIASASGSCIYDNSTHSVSRFLPSKINGINVNYYEVEYQITSGTAYFNTSDCSRGYLGDGAYKGYLTFDDWKFGGDGVSSITPLTNGGIQWKRRQAGTYINLEQVIEYLPAGTYMLTAWVSDTSKLNQSFCYYDGNYPSNTKIYDDGTKVVNRITLSTDCYNIHFGLQLKEISGNTLDVYKVKLEAGSVATEYTVPNPEEELAKCQRYFYRTKLTVGVGQLLETQKANIVVSLPVAMRVKPSVSWKGTWYIRCNGTWYLAVSSLVGVNGDAEQAIYEIQVNTNSAGTVGAVCDSFVQNGYVDFSADL